MNIDLEYFPVLTKFEECNSELWSCRIIDGGCETTSLRVTFCKRDICKNSPSCNIQTKSSTNWNRKKSNLFLSYYKTALDNGKCFSVRKMSK